jgi:hypothetical protein
MEDDTSKHFLQVCNNNTKKKGLGISCESVPDVLLRELLVITTTNNINNNIKYQYDVDTCIMVDYDVKKKKD